MQVGKSCRRKTPGFCEAAMSAKSANCGASFLLADLRNASLIWPLADDLRGAIVGRAAGSRRGAAMSACPRGAWARGGREVSFQRTAIGLERPTTLNLASRAATFCRLATRFFGGRFWMEAAGRRGLARVRNLLRPPRRTRRRRVAESVGCKCENRRRLHHDDESREVSLTTLA